jgi:O-antigen ligase
LIVSVVGILQIPAGGRVSLPFEGQGGEPNTFGGYLLFIGSIAFGLLTSAARRTTKIQYGAFILIISIPFLYTFSRASYLAFGLTVLTFGLMAKQRILVVAVIAIFFIISPFVMPRAVTNRIGYTFTQEKHPSQITIGSWHLDTSTSARLVGWQRAIKDWRNRPFLGYGVTGYKFIDAQYPRVLVETGLLGFTAFAYLLYSIFKLVRVRLKQAQSPFGLGLVRGVAAGYCGLLVHALAANTFIIVRIMEPFWLLVGMIAIMPSWEDGKRTDSLLANSFKKV